MTEEKENGKPDLCDAWSLRYAGSMPVSVLRKMISKEALDCGCAAQGLTEADRPKAAAELAALCDVKQ